MALNHFRVLISYFSFFLIIDDDMLYLIWFWESFLIAGIIINLEQMINLTLGENFCIIV